MKPLSKLEQWTVVITVIWLADILFPGLDAANFFGAMVFAVLAAPMLAIIVWWVKTFTL